MAFSDASLGGATRQPRHRFSLLLLDEGEDYICDWVAFCSPPPGKLDVSGGAGVRGRLRLCSLSLVFDPDDQRLPILKLPFAKVDQLDKDDNVEGALSVTSTQWLRMKASGVDSPYVNDKSGPATWRFSLAFAKLSALLGPAKQQLATCRLPHFERLVALKEAARAREDAATFDVSRLADLSDRPLLSAPAAQVTLLLREPGRLVVTRGRLYFQPLHNLNADTPVRSRPLSAIAAVARRRHQLRHVALEVFFMEPDARAAGGWEGASIFLTFHTQAARDEALTVLKAQPTLGGVAGSTAALAASALLEGDPGWLGRVTGAWQRGDVSTFEYLLYLNLAAGRSFNDLAQWPVFPWVLADYSSPQLDLHNGAHFRDLSKPMGALNPGRLAALRERARQLASSGERSFLYGTHYSTPGYVLFWLLRALPGHALRLQGGRFDAPDRLFADVAEAWHGVTHAPADVKELIPEFYAPPAQWLLNTEGLPLGTRQSGAPVGDVVLPPWAQGPAHFVSCMRAALEAPPVSGRLHLWIDLIFGVAQRGDAAVARDNVFHPMTYEGAVDMEAVKDPVQRAALEAQIQEFGQTPRQLFRQAHPARLVAPPQAMPAPDASQAAVSHRTGVMALVRMLLAVAAPFTGGPNAAAMPVGSPPSAAPAVPVPGITATSGSPAQPTAAATLDGHGDASPGAVPPVAGKGAVPPVFTGPVPLARLRLVVPAPSGSSVAPPVAPSWRVHAHFGGGTSVAAWGDAVYSVGTDTWLRVRTASHGTPLHAACLGRLPLSCVALLPLPAGAQPGSRPTAVVGSLDGFITIVSVDYGVTRAHWGAHDDAVSALAIAGGAPGGPRVVSAGWDGNLKVWDVSHARGPLATVTPPTSAGGPTSPLVDLPGADGRLWSLCCDDAGVRLLAGTATGAVACYDSRQHQSSGPAWHVTATGGGGVCALACDPTASCCLAAGEDGLLRLLDARRAGAQVASVDVGHGMPCRCVAMAGGTVLAGTDGGSLVAWDAAAVAPGLVLAPPVSGGTRPGVTPWHPFGGPAGDALCGVAVSGDTHSPGAAVVVALSASGAMRGYVVPHGWDTHAA